MPLESGWLTCMSASVERLIILLWEYGFMVVFMKYHPGLLSEGWNQEQVTNVLCSNTNQFCLH